MSNNATFNDKDITLQWNSVGTTNYADSIIKGYRIEIYHDSYANANLLRTVFKTDTELTYTLDMNVNDGGPYSTLLFVFFTLLNNNIESLASVPFVVTNETPDAPSNLVATSITKGVQFNWTKCTDLDFKYYSYRTKVASGGTWSSWVNTEANTVTRSITDAEITINGNKASIYIEVKTLDWFNQESSVSSANNTANIVIHKDIDGRPTITVSASANKGDYTTIASAIDSLPSNGGIITLKEGTYITAPINVPPKNITISGINEDVSILQNIASSNIFNFATVCNGYRYSFDNFSIESQNNNTFSKMFNMVGVSDNLVDAETTFSNITINLKNDVANLNGDCGIYGDFYKGYLTVNTCKFNNGKEGIKSTESDSYTSLIDINQSIFDGQVADGIQLVNGKRINITSNKFTNIHIRGVYLKGGPITELVSGKIGNNIFESINASSATSYIAPIYNRGGNIDIETNAIIINTDKNIHLYGIYMDAEQQNTKMSENTVNIYAPASTKSVAGLYSRITDGEINNNIITINASDTPTGSYFRQGIRSEFDRTIISTNNINMTTSEAHDVGIYLSSGCDNNFGKSNITYNCGVSVDDNGSLNSIETKDV